MNNGRVIKLVAGVYDVLTENNEIVSCKGRGRFRNDGTTIVVGDLVVIDDTTIIEVKPRTNELYRPKISNVDQVILVFSVKEPDFSPLLLDKFLAMIEHQNIHPIICLTKMELVTDEAKVMIKEYQDANYEIIFTSSYENTGIDDFKKLLKDKISVLAGQTGVGKSSLLNCIDEDLDLKTDIISKALGRGKHTTRYVHLMGLAGGLVADTPGFSSLELQLTARELATSYHDFNELSNECKFRGCLHDSEIGCAVKDAVENNVIAKRRYDNYLNILNTIKNRKERY